MDLTYFVVDRNQQLQKVSRDEVERLWRNETGAEGLPIDPDDELQLVTALCDESLIPLVIWFVRLELSGGRITDQSRIAAYEAMDTRKKRRYDHPAARRQFTGWPSDWRQQLAVALDVPVADLQKVGIGGPLLMSELWGIPLERVLNYFEEAADRE